MRPVHVQKQGTARRAIRPAGLFLNGTSCQPLLCGSTPAFELSKAAGAVGCLSAVLRRHVNIR
jgi:hypothetical protein